MTISQETEASTKIGIYLSDKVRFDELQRWLTIQNKGVPVSQPQVVRWLLDQVEQLHKGNEQ